MFFKRDHFKFTQNSEEYHNRSTKTNSGVPKTSFIPTKALSKRVNSKNLQIALLDSCKNLVILHPQKNEIKKIVIKAAITHEIRKIKRKNGEFLNKFYFYYKISLVISNFSEIFPQIFI